MGIGFGVDTAPALVCGYVVATLFAMISVTPQGVGVVEAAVVVAFTSFGESAAAGTAIGLVYRGIVFWMPFIIGAVLINTTKAFKGDVKQAAYDQDMGAVAGTAPTAARLQEEARADEARFKRAAALCSRMAGAAGAHAAPGGQPVAGTVPPEVGGVAAGGAGAAGGAAMANAAAQTVPFTEGEAAVPAVVTVPFAEGAAPASAARTVPFAEAGAPAEAERTEPSVRIASTQDQPTVPFEPAAGAQAAHAADMPDDLPGEEGSS